MKREELKYFDCNEDSYDSCGFKFEPMEVYDKAEADSVMDAMEARIKELNAENIVKDMVGAELHNENKELKRAKRAHLIELGDAEECIKELEAENKALRFNLADWKHKAEEMELTAKSFDAEIARSHERIQKLTNENADFVMEVEKLQERIKELEKVVEEKTDAVKYWKNMSVENGHDSWSRY